MDLRVSLSRQALNDRYKWVVKASGPGQVFGNVHPPWSGQLGRRVTYIVPILALCAFALNSALRCALCAARPVLCASLCAFLAVWCALAVCVRPPQPAKAGHANTWSFSLSLVFFTSLAQIFLIFGCCWSVLAQSSPWI